MIYLCKCGCGTPVKIIDQNDRSQGLVKGRPRDFVHGHHRRKLFERSDGPNPSGVCQCGCGKSTTRAMRVGDGYERGQFTRFCKGHRSTRRTIEDVRRKGRKDAGVRRARKLGQFIEPVDPLVVYQMHGGMCGICKQFVSTDDFHVDHVIPLARGGLHGYINVQPAHPLCNSKKGVKCEL